MSEILILIVFFFLRLSFSLENLADDKYRPQWHLLPPSNWMNDPCGPIKIHDEYHIFYQYNPYSPLWGNISWGHAHSKDLVYWNHDPISLSPSTWYDIEGVFSGSAVVDTNPFDVESQQIYIFYTGVHIPTDPTHVTLKDGKHPWREIQASAVTNAWGGLLDWRKRNWNEALLSDPPFPFDEITGFRDPSVKFDATSREWKMLVGSGIFTKGGNVVVYTSGSSGLQEAQWTLAGILIQGTAETKYVPGTDPVHSDYMWECPDIVDLGVADMLIYGTSGYNWYSLGHLDWGADGKGPNFEPFASMGANEERDMQRAKLDHGIYYAARFQSYDVDKDSVSQKPAIVFGWLPEPASRTDEALLSAGWAGVMSMPRSLDVIEIPNEQACGLYRSAKLLSIAPAPFLQKLRGPEIAPAEMSDLPKLYNLSAEIDYELMTPVGEGPDGNFKVDLSFYPADTNTSNVTDLVPFLSVQYGYLFLEEEQRYIGELKVGQYSCQLPVFPSACGADPSGSGAKPTLRIFLDGSVAEVYAGYDCVITARPYAYDAPPGTSVALQPVLSCQGNRVASCGDIVSKITSWQLQAISDDRLTT